MSSNVAASHADKETAVHSGNTPELGDILIQYLTDLGVAYIFGVPGGAIEPLYNALARSERRHGTRAIVARHECGAAFMADGYYRRTGKLGVCCATTGPGATNLITGAASAYENHIPMLVITAQTSLRNFGRGALQESSCTGINTLGMFQHCTRYNSLVSNIEQFEHKLVSALISAFGPAPGPAHLTIPLDLLRTASPVMKPSYNINHLLNQPKTMDMPSVNKLVQRIITARKLVFLVGESCAPIAGLLLALASRLQATVLTTPHGKGFINSQHPQYGGTLGFAGHDHAKMALLDPQLDTIIAVGTNLGEWSTNGWDQILLNDRLVHIDDIRQNFTRSPMAALHVFGELTTIFEHLLANVVPQTKDAVVVPLAVKQFAAQSQLQDQSQLHSFGAIVGNKAPIKPQSLMRELPRLLPPGTRYLVDSGNSMAWAVHYLHPHDRRLSPRRDREPGLFFGAFEFASMGWAIGAAVGMALGAISDTVVCITGDGSLLMSGQELSVAVQERLPVIFIVLNDSALGMVKHGQRLAGAEAIGYRLPVVDFSAYARAMGAHAHTIHSLSDLRALDMTAILERTLPTLLDVYIDTEEVPPIGTRMKILGDAAR